MGRLVWLKPPTMKIEIVKHGEFYYWLIEYGEAGAKEGFAKTLKAAMKDIMNETGVWR